ncbi:MAG TPA: hypothetical protein DIU44_07780 [Acholeplasmatales bacterium]|nr:hypothetical protein [Acholeplasmatales bacterium]
MNDVLPFCNEQLKKISSEEFLPELLETVRYISIFETKIEDSRLEKCVYLPKMEISEIVSSLRIEGTHTKIEDYYQGELFPEEKSVELTEFKNYTSALKKGTRLVKYEGFTNEVIKDIHKMMFSNVKNIKAGITIGDYKKVNNYIARDNIRVYSPPKVEETQEYMNDLMNFINDDSPIIHPLVKCAVIHAQFESIHPFEDGNGRIGRILIPIYLCYAGLIGAPLFYISEAIDDDKYLYYNSLTETRTGNYNLWIKYFLQKCTIQAKKHIKFIQNIDELYKKITQQVEQITNSVLTPKLVRVIFENPIITSKKMAESLNLSITQANRYLRALEEEKILYTNERKRNISYYFTELLSLIC